MGREDTILENDSFENKIGRLNKEKEPEGGRKLINKTKNMVVDYVGESG